MKLESLCPSICRALFASFEYLWALSVVLLYFCWSLIGAYLVSSLLAKVIGAIIHVHTFMKSWFCAACTPQPKIKSKEAKTFTRANQ